MLALRNSVRIMFVVMFGLGIGCLDAQSHPATRRLTTVTSTFSSLMGVSSGLQTYHYTLGHPTLIDSLCIAYNDLVNGEVYQYQRFVGAIEEVANGTKYEYTIYDLGASYPVYNNHYYVILDAENRLVESKYGSWDPSTEQFVDPIHNIRRYNEAGYADSLYYSAGENTRIYAKRCFEDGMLSRTDVYEWTGQNWNNNGRFLYAYPGVPVVLPVHLNPFIGADIDYNYFKLELAINTKYVPQNISYYRWSSEVNEWLFSGPVFYHERVTSNSVVVDETWEVSGPPSDFYNHYFNLAGDYYQCEYADTTDDYSLEIYTWDRELDNDDSTSPAPPQKLKCYPNPFLQDVSFSFEGESKAPYEITVYNIRGQLIRTWENLSGKGIIWDGTDSDASPVNRGIYMIYAKQGNSRSIQRVVKL